MLSKDSMLECIESVEMGDERNTRSPADGCHPVRCGAILSEHYVDVPFHQRTCDAMGKQVVQSATAHQRLEPVAEAPPCSVAKKWTFPMDE
jgi:hypothetical protein